MNEEEKYLPTEILNKAVRSGNEYGWKREDFLDVLNSAVNANLGIVGGQIQFKLPDGTCELYWHQYDSTERIPNETWTSYCERTKVEVTTAFSELPTNSELVKEGVENFDFLAERVNNGVDIEQHLIFVLYFNTQEAELEQQRNG